MTQPYMKMLELGELTIAASCETQASDETPAFYPATLLVFVEQGSLHIKKDQELFTISKGQFGLLRKYTQSTIFKSYAPEEGSAKTYFFALTNEFIRKVIQDFDIPSDIPAVSERIIQLGSTALLKGLIHSISDYVENDAKLDAHLVQLKTYEALYAIIKAKPSLAAIFREYSLAERADLSLFMNHNYLYNVPLATIAKQTGRSLSTFTREFKAIYNETPHRWIMKQRLQFAKDLMIKEAIKPSEVYLKAGFEDLAHFSKAFKKQFKMPPSKFAQSLY